MINVLIADDHNVFAEGISSLLSDTENICVVASCSNTADAKDMLIKTKPQVILLDISMPKVEDGMKLCDHVLQYHPDTKIIILTMHDDLSIVKRVLKKGAHGFLLKNTTKAELLEAIAHVSEGKPYINDYIQKLMDEHQHKVRKHTLGAGVELHLTPREKEVLFLISEGYTTQQIADKLFVTTKAVEFHRSSLLVKFDVPNTALLIKTAMEANFFMMIAGHKSAFKALLTGTILWMMSTLTGFGQSREEETDSLNLLEINKSIINNNNNPQALAHLYLKLGKSYESIYGFNKFSLEAFQQSAGLFKQTGDSANYYDAIMKVATIYYVDNFTKKYALEHYNAALRYFKKTGDIENKIHCQLSIIDTKKLQKPFDYKLITELKEVEKECISYRYDLQLSYAHNLLAICYIINGNLNEARKYANLSQMYAEGAKIKWLVSLNYFYMGKIEDHNHQRKKALDYYLKALALSGETKNVAYAKDITESIATCYTELGDHKNASIYHKKTLSFINQFYESEQTKNFRLEKVNNQFKNLQAESKLIEQEIRKTNMQNVILVIVLIFLVSGAIALYIGNRQQKLISNQQEYINEQKIKNLELKSLESLIQGQENERSRIARDLHDSLGIQLSQIKFFIETHGKNFLPEEKKSINRIIDEAFYEIRVISHNIHPFSLSNFGLIIALEDLIHKLQSIKKTDISIRKYGNFPELNPEAIALLYRATQELINNALKHAHPNKIIIQIITNDDELLINVEDDGNGFEVGQEEKGSGINNVIFRVEYLSGQVIWQSSPEKGTSVMISVPLKKVTAS